MSALIESGGFATRAGLARLRATRHGIEKAVRDGRIIRISRGIYGLGLPDGRGGLLLAVTAVRGVVSHDSAAVLWGLEMVGSPRLVVTVARDRRRAASPGVRVVRADVDEAEVRDGMPVTTALRTVVDCARDLPLAEAVVIADSALRKRLITIEELRSVAHEIKGAKAARVKRVATLADPKSASVLESLLRVLLVEAGLAPDVTQYPVLDEDGELISWVDFAYLAARLLVEADGFEFHRDRSDYRKDRRRANAHCRLGWRLLRFSWEDVRIDPDYVIEAVRFELVKTRPRRVA